MKKNMKPTYLKKGDKLTVELTVSKDAELDRKKNQHSFGAVVKTEFGDPLMTIPEVIISKPYWLLLVDRSVEVPTGWFRFLSENHCEDVWAKVPVNDEFVNANGFTVPSEVIMELLATEPWELV